MILVSLVVPTFLISLPNFQLVPIAYASGPPVPQNMTLINAESFEGTWPPTGWSETGEWNKESNYAYAGTYSADFNGASYPSRSGDLDTPSLNCSGATYIYVEFWWMDTGLDNDDFLLKFYDGSNWDTIQDMNLLSHSENVWTFYSLKVTDNQYFVSTFKVRWSAVTVSTGEHIYVDVVTVKKEIMAQDTPPVWSNAGTSNTVAGEPTLFHVKWSDDVGLSGFIFGTNNTGTWVNDTWAPMSGTTNWSNVTKILNSNVGVTVQWRVWANDTSNNWSNTGILSLTTTRAVITQLGFCFDGSSSISSSEFAIIKAGVAAAVRNASQMPHDGTVELTVVQFGTGITAYARVEVAPTVVTAANFENIATTIEGISQIGSYTPTADGLLLTWLQMKGSSNFAIASRQVINVASNGFPNRALKATPPVGWPTPPGTAWGDVAYVRDNAAAEGLDEIDAEGIGVTPESLANMTYYLVYPQPGTIAPPYNPGWVRWVANATEFATAVGEKFIVVLQQPVACFTVSNDHPNVCETITFNASASYDPDGWIVNYTWNFGNSNTTTVTDPIITHHYDTFGNYTVILTVADNDGLTDNASKPIWVRKHPVARFTYSPSYPQVHEEVVFNASDSTPDGGYIVNYTWNFGDSNITTVTDPIITHHYDNYGNYIVILNVTDSEGKWDTESKVITVRAHPHADFTWSPPSPQVCEMVTFNASASTPDGGTIISYKWDFGDGNITIIGDDEPITPIITHHYTALGDYNVTLTVTDSENKSDSTWKMITVISRKYYLTVQTDPAGIVTIPGEGWYDNCTYVNLTAPQFVPNATGVNGQRYRFANWTVNGEVFTTLQITVHMDANHTAIAHYIVQYRATFAQTGLDSTATGTVVTVNGAPKAFGDLPFITWVDNGSVITYSYNSTVSSSVSGKRFKQVNVTGPASPIGVTGPVTVTGNYKTQYRITVTASPSGALGGTFKVTYTQCGTLYTNVQKTTTWTEWVDASTTVTVSEPQDIINGPTGTRYKFDHYDPSDSVTMDQAKTITLVYKTQYKLTVISAHDSPVPSVGEHWYDAGTPITASVTSPADESGGTRYRCTGWTGTGSVPSSGTGTSVSFTINQPSSITWNWIAQYYLTVTSPYDSPNPTSGWFDTGTSITASVTSPWAGTNGVRYVCTGWTGTGSVPASGSAASVTFTINQASSITWNWKTQYYLTVKTDPTGLSPAPTPPSGWYDKSQSVQLTALTVSGYTFEYWDVDGTSRGSGVNPITVPMDNPHTATAHYVSPQPRPVGGYALPITLDLGTSNSLIPQIGLASALSATVTATIILVRRRKRTLKREH